MVATPWVQVSPGIERLDCEDAAEFLSVLDPISDDWEWEPALQRHSWMFRGHADSTWTLTPTAWRAPAPSAIQGALQAASDRVGAISQIRSWDHTGSLPPPPQPDLAVARRVICQANAELSLLSAFVHRADELGLETPGKLPPTLHHDTVFHREQPVAADDFLQLDGVDHQAALAQHHGVPTRLLDWTDDALTAAFFAAQPSRAERLAVWAINQRVASGSGMPLWGQGQPNPVGLSIYVVRPKRTGNPFLRAQRGAFTVPWGAGCFALVNSGAFPTLEQFANGATGEIDHTALLRCVTLPRSAAPEVRSLLERRLVTRERLMPSLEVVAESVLAEGRQKIRLLPPPSPAQSPTPVQDPTSVHDLPAGHLRYATAPTAPGANRHN